MSFKFISSAICLILYINCCSGRQAGWTPWERWKSRVGKKRRWWMTGEISHDGGRVGVEKNLKTQNREERNFTAASLFLLLSFLFWHGGNCRVGKVKGFLCYCCFCSLPVPPNWTILFSSPPLSHLALSAAGFTPFLTAPCLSLLLHVSFL